MRRLTLDGERTGKRGGFRLTETRTDARGIGEENESIVFALDAECRIDLDDLLESQKECEAELADLGVVAAEHLSENFPGHGLWTF